MNKFEKVQRRKALKQQRQKQEINALRKKIKKMPFGDQFSRERRRRNKIMNRIKTLESM